MIIWFTSAVTLTGIHDTINGGWFILQNGESDIHGDAFLTSLRLLRLSTPTLHKLFPPAHLYEPP